MEQKKKKMMKVSIIITNYNYGRYLERCIRSCLNQNLNNLGTSSLNRGYEIIVVDDNSTDNSKKIIKKFSKTPNFRFILNPKNIGVAASSNKAILKAKGKYVIRVDSDDFISNHLINILSYYLDENKEKFAVACDYHLVDEDEIKISKVSARVKPISCGIMYDRSKLIKYGLYNIKFRHREEEELRLRLGDKYNLSYIDLPLYRYRIHKTNKTKSNEYIEEFRDKIETIRNKVSKKKYSKKNIIAIIPARGNSKRLKNKNILKIKNKPMISYVINSARECIFLNDVYVSSESEKVLNISKKYKAKTIKRPKELSEDKIFKIDVIRHAVKIIEKKMKKKISIVVSLQANSPEIKSVDIENLIKHLIKYNLQEVISVDNNLNSNAAIRVMNRNAVFQKSLSTYLGCVKTNIVDIHFKKDLKKINI